MIDFSKMRFLVVDDFAEFRSSIRGILGLLGVHKIDTASKGEDVIELCRRNRYDVILHDYNLGDGINGQQILEHLHAEKLLPPHCIFIMVTAENTQAMVLAAIECQPDDYLSKPFNKVALQTRLVRLVKRKQVLAPLLTALEKNDCHKVLQACRDIETGDPRHAPLCQHYKARALYNLGHFLQLEKFLEQLVRNRPASWNLQMLARLWLRQGKLERLTALLDAAVRQFPLMPELHDIRAELAVRNKDLPEAQAALQHAVSLSPNTVRRQIALARLAWINDHTDLALQALRQCWEVGRHSIAFDAEIVWLLASMLMRGNKGRMAEELKSWLRILDKNEMQTPVLQPAIALLKFVQAKNRGNEPSAEHLRMLQQGILEQTSSYCAVSLLQLGDWLHQLGAREAAEECWQTCARRHLAQPGVVRQLAQRMPKAELTDGWLEEYYRALALHANEETEAAAHAFSSLLQHAPAALEANLAAGRFYAGQLNKGEEEARSRLQECVERIGQLSALEPEATELTLLKSQLGTFSW